MANFNNMSVLFKWDQVDYLLYGFSTIDIEDSREITRVYSNNPSQRGNGVAKPRGYDVGEEVTITSTYLDAAVQAVLNRAFEEGLNKSGTLLVTCDSTGQVLELSGCSPKNKNFSPNINSDPQDRYKCVFTVKITKNTLSTDSNV